MPSLHKTVLLAATAAALGLATTEAAVLNYDPGDLLLAFRATSDPGQSNNYIVNLGPAATFREATATFDLNVGNIGADLVSLYGANWHTRSDVFWSVSGTSNNASAVNGDPLRTLYATKAQSTLGVVETPWNRGSSAAQATPTNKMLSMGAAFEAVAGTPNNSTVNSDVAFIQPSTATNSYGSLAPNFQYFVASPSTIEGNFGNGAAGTALDLFRMQTGSSSALGDYEGTFTISQSGQVTFNVVPEPGSALLAVAAGLVPFVRRRRVATV